jgi:hypothetical protein
MINFIRNHSSVFLLLSLLALAILQGLVSERTVQSDVPALALLVTLATATVEAASSRILAIITGALAALTFCAVIAARWFQVELAVQGQWVFLSIFVGFCALRLLRKVLARPCTLRKVV